MSKQKFVDIFIIHGWASGRGKNWFPWIKSKLEVKDLNVFIVELPNPIRPVFKDWFDEVLKYKNLIGPKTIIVAHSLGGILALHFLEKLKIKIAACFLISAPIVNPVSRPNNFVLDDFFWKKIKWNEISKKSKKFVVLHGKNDLMVPYDNGLRLSEILGADFLTSKSDGHFIGKKYPIILKTIENLIRYI